MQRRGCAIILAVMAKTSKLTKREKQRGKRKLLIPSKEIQEKMKPIMLDDFTGLLRKAIQPQKNLSGA